MISTQPLFDSLSDPIRRRIVALLLDEAELCVCELLDVLKLPQPKVSRHLAVLREAGVVNVRRDGTRVFYRVAPSLPLWAYRVLEHMKHGAAGDPQFQSDATRLAARKVRFSERASARLGVAAASRAGVDQLQSRDGP